MVRHRRQQGGPHRAAEGQVILSLAFTIAAGAFVWALAAPPPRKVHSYGLTVQSLVRPVASHAYAEGAPPGFTGGFTEQSCDACHFHAAPNAGPGKLTLDGIPDRFVAGQAYRVTLSLTQSDMKLAGFQLSARFKDDGAQAGTLAKESGSDARVGIETQSGVQYAGQRREGAAMVTPNESRWTLMWTAPLDDARGCPEPCRRAPSAVRTVVFHVAANGANGDERADGDYVYVTSVESLSSDLASSVLSDGSRRRPGRPSRAR